MINRELEAKSRLVALARKKAERDGTTLESKVEKWLARYVNEPDDVNGKKMDVPAPSKGPAPQTIITRKAKSGAKTNPPVRSGGDTRSAAYRRLLGVMSDSTKRTS